MTHKGILENFSFRFLTRVLGEEIGTLVFKAKCYRHLKTPEEELNYILEHLMLRWNTVYNSKNYSDLYKYNTYITIATYLNKYGYKDKHSTKKAIEGLTKLKNDEFGLLPKHQYKKAEQAITFLSLPVHYRTKKPGFIETVTQFRKGDLFSIKFEGYYCAAIINNVQNIYESVEVYTFEKVFVNEPTISDLKDLSFLKDKHSIATLNYINDPAGQFKLIENTEWETQKHSLIISDIYSYLNDLKVCKFTTTKK